MVWQQILCMKYVQFLCTALQCKPNGNPQIRSLGVNKLCAGLATLRNASVPRGLRSQEHNVIDTIGFKEPQFLHEIIGIGLVPSFPLAEAMCINSDSH